MASDIAHDRALPIMANRYYEFAIPSSVRGYHVYKDIWEATIGENLVCQREQNNRHNPLAVAVPGYQIIAGVIARGRNSTDYG